MTISLYADRLRWNEAPEAEEPAPIATRPSGRFARIGGLIRDCGASLAGRVRSIEWKKIAVLYGLPLAVGLASYFAEDPSILIGFTALHQSRWGYSQACSEPAEHLSQIEVIEDRPSECILALADQAKPDESASSETEENMAQIEVIEDHPSESILAVADQANPDESALSEAQEALLKISNECLQSWPDPELQTLSLGVRWLIPNISPKQLHAYLDAIAPCSMYWNCQAVKDADCIFIGEFHERVEMHRMQKFVLNLLLNPNTNVLLEESDDQIAKERFARLYGIPGDGVAKGWDIAFDFPHNQMLYIFGFALQKIANYLAASGNGSIKQEDYQYQDLMDELIKISQADPRIKRFCEKIHEEFFYLGELEITHNRIQRCFHSLKELFTEFSEVCDQRIEETWQARQAHLVEKIKEHRQIGGPPLIIIGGARHFMKQGQIEPALEQFLGAESLKYVIIDPHEPNNAAPVVKVQEFSPTEYAASTSESLFLGIQDLIKGS